MTRLTHHHDEPRSLLTRGAWQRAGAALGLLLLLWLAVAWALQGSGGAA